MLWILGIIAFALGIAATNVVMKNIASEFRMLRSITMELEEDIKHLRKLSDEDFGTLDERINKNKRAINAIRHDINPTLDDGLDINKS